MEVCIISFSVLPVLSLRVFVELSVIDILYIFCPLINSIKQVCKIFV